jgi:hypothetical protein
MISAWYHNQVLPTTVKPQFSKIKGAPFSGFWYTEIRVNWDDGHVYYIKYLL